MFAWTTLKADTLAALLRALLGTKAAPKKAERR
jgi:hypothetical protein